MLAQIIFTAIVIANLILNTIKLSFDRKIEDLKNSDSLATTKDVHRMHSLMSKSQTLGSNVIMLAGLAIYLIFLQQGNVRVIAMIIFILSFYLAYIIDILIQRRNSKKRIKELEYSIESKRVNRK